MYLRVEVWLISGAHGLTDGAAVLLHDGHQRFMYTCERGGWLSGVYSAAGLQQSRNKVVTGD